MLVGVLHLQHLQISFCNCKTVSVCVCIYQYMTCLCGYIVINMHLMCLGARTCGFARSWFPWKEMSEHLLLTTSCLGRVSQPSLMARDSFRALLYFATSPCDFPTTFDEMDVIHFAHFVCHPVQSFPCFSRSFVWRAKAAQNTKMSPCVRVLLLTTIDNCCIVEKSQES